MKVSLIVPTLGQEKFLPDTLGSIVAQNYDQLEVILVDGGCSSENRVTVDRFPQLNIQLISERDNGQADAINKGFRAASGDIFNCSDQGS